ncbi:MAG: DUF998 domain-containing protein [Actinomycetota bacterium]|nr:DUF998 domain-containing protein [Actinomycetota bacterium]
MSCVVSHPVTSSDRPRPSRALALAGVVAPILFAVVVTLLTVVEYDFARESGWHPIRRTGAGWPSLLALGELGWLLGATLACCGLLGLAFAAGLYRGMNGSWWSTIAALALAVLAAAVGLEAFTTDPPGSTAPATWHGEIHDAAYQLVVASALIAPLLVALALWEDSRWRGYGPYSLATAGVLLATLALQTVREYAQLVEYVFFATLLVWLELLALRLLRLSRG